MKQNVWKIQSGVVGLFNVEYVDPGSGGGEQGRRKDVVRSRDKSTHSLAINL
jgi:hypothetical protein